MDEYTCTIYVDVRKGDTNRYFALRSGVNYHIRETLTQDTTDHKGAVVGCSNDEL